MRRAFLSASLLLAGCNSAAETHAKSGRDPRAVSACAQQIFEESRFTVCDPGKGRIELVAAARGEIPVRRLDQLDLRLGRRADDVAFAMNAGMYGEDGRPIGLAIVEGREVR